MSADRTRGGLRAQTGPGRMSGFFIVVTPHDGFSSEEIAELVAKNLRAYIGEGYTLRDPTGAEQLLKLFVEVEESDR